MKKNEEIISLNTELYDDFFVQELEVRLETDPLMLGGLMELLESCALCNGYSVCESHCFNYYGCPDQCLTVKFCGEHKL
jgi:hypothetical protein